MVVFTCEKCNKIFNKKSTYVMHTEYKKKPCDGKNEIVAPILQKDNIFAPKLPKHHILAPKIPKNNDNIIDAETVNNKENVNKDELEKEDDINNNVNKCEYCNKTFIKLYGLQRHNSRCKVKNNIVEALKKENDIKNNIVEELKKENDKKNEEILKLKNEVEKLSNDILNKQTTVNNGTINNNNNNNNIQINIVNYGQEDFSKLDLTKILQYDNSFIEMVFRDIHCNPELPQYHNILLPSLTRYDILVKLNNEWLKRNKNDILKERYSTIREYIMELYDEESKINKKTADNRFFHFLKQIKLVDPTHIIFNPEEEKKIINGIANVLYNHKNNIKSTVKIPLIKKKLKVSE